jgi:hypothetical protein
MGLPVWIGKDDFSKPARFQFVKNYGNGATSVEPQVFAKKTTK